MLDLKEINEIFLFANITLNLLTFQYDLVCNDSPLASLAISLIFIGSLFGSSVTGVIGDGQVQQLISWQFPSFIQ